jgi:simple sugar transport system ATP-binding protein
MTRIRALADRILVIYEGEIVGELHAGAASIEEMGLLMAGGTRA